MRVIEIGGLSRRSAVFIGERMANLAQHLPPGRAVVITDTNLLRLHREAFPPLPVLSIGCGESVKTLETVKSLYETLADLSVDRSTFILGVGGGVVCDVTGFVASTYLRGLRFGFVATTLLAQVDASVGGKNGVNLEGYKNLVGCFNQPEFVLCDLHLLDTLPESEVANGMAEIVKHALIADAGLFAFLEARAAEALALDPATIEKLIGDSVAIKAGVVARDEREAGERRKLNFGHTFGHALERVAGLSHGEAVSVGMAIAARLSVEMGRLPAAACERMLGLLRRLRLPVTAAADAGRVMDALRKDKKRKADRIHFVLLDDIGRAAVEEIEIRELERQAAEIAEMLGTGSRS
jgi:3-dehydroquinate synthase